MNDHIRQWRRKRVAVILAFGLLGLMAVLVFGLRPGHLPPPPKPPGWTPDQVAPPKPGVTPYQAAPPKTGFTPDQVAPPKSGVTPDLVAPPKGGVIPNYPTSPMLSPPRQVPELQPSTDPAPLRIPNPEPQVRPAFCQRVDALFYFWPSLN